jgi:hypothetical protein
VFFWNNFVEITHVKIKIFDNLYIKTKPKVLINIALSYII